MTMKYEIYIKGCWERRDNSISLAFVVTKDGTAIEKRYAKYTSEIKMRTGTATIIPNKGQYQAELCALAWALSYCANGDAEFTVYSNNQCVVGWINKDKCPDDYADLFSICQRLAKGRIEKAEWIAKSDGNAWNRLMNDAASNILNMEGKTILRIL